jgi:hypothetical protein
MYCFPTLAVDRVPDIEENERTGVRLLPRLFPARNKQRDKQLPAHLPEERAK